MTDLRTAIERRSDELDALAETQDLEPGLHIHGHCPTCHRPWWSTPTVEGSECVCPPDPESPF